MDGSTEPDGESNALEVLFDVDGDEGTAGLRACSVVEATGVTDELGVGCGVHGGGETDGLRVDVEVDGKPILDCDCALEVGRGVLSL